MAFSLGSGSAFEGWQIALGTLSLLGLGLQTSDLGATYLYPEVELEITGANNLVGVQLRLQDATALVYSQVGTSFSGANGSGHLPNSSGEVTPIPQKWVLRGSPFLLPATGLTPTDVANLTMNLVINLDASGGADSATAVIKINYLGLKKAYVS